jgi:hypothetical protein
MTFVWASDEVIVVRLTVAAPLCTIFALSQAWSEHAAVVISASSYGAAP